MMAWSGGGNVKANLGRAKKVAYRAAGAVGDHLLGGNPTARAPLDTATAALVEALDQALSVHVVHSNISKAVDECFSLFPTHVGVSGYKHLHFQEVLTFAAQVAVKLRLPAWVFDGIDVDAELFDFNGDGMMDEMETKRLFKKVLQRKRVQLAGKKPIQVPTMTLEQAGYTVIKELGRGGQGAMYLGTKQTWFSCMVGGQKYCIKFYDKRNPAASGIEELMDEYQVMVSLDNDHIAKTYDVFQDNQYYYLVNEPYFGGDFTKLGNNAFDEGVKMSEGWWRPIFKQCLEGLTYLHSRGIMHCDIKEPNLMVAKGGSYKKPRAVLIDFGLSSAFTDARTGVCGTPGYIPPETWHTGLWFPRGDTFSMGVTFFQLMTGQVPTPGGSVMGVLQAPRDGDYAAAALNQPLPWESFPAAMLQLRELVERMTNRDRARRPKPGQALTHPWFSSSSDVELPTATIQGLVGTAAAHALHEDLTVQLANGNKLADLHTLAQKFQEADPTGEGVVDAHVAAAVLIQHGVDKSLVKKCTDAGNGVFKYAAVTHEAVAAKEQYGHHFVKELFDKLDTDKSGTLSADELMQLLRSQAFDCPEDHLDELMAWMDADGDGVISFEEFSHAAIEYGRVANRSEVDLHALGGISVQKRLSMLGQVPPPRQFEVTVPQQAEHSAADVHTDHEPKDEGIRQHCKLMVVIIAGRDLMDTESQLACNLYCTCGVSSAKFATFQTPVLQHSGSPIWNCQHEVDCYVGDAVDFAVLNASSSRSPSDQDGLIGLARLPCERFMPHGFDAELTVTGPGSGIRGLLRVCVVPLDHGDPSHGEEAAPWHHVAGALSPWQRYVGGLQSSEATVTWGRSWTEEREPVVRLRTSNALPTPSIGGFVQPVVYAAHAVPLWAASPSWSHGALA